MEEYFAGSYLKELRVLLDLVIAIILTGIIGIERELKNKPAGFRTNMLVGAAAALLVSIGNFVTEEYAANGLSNNLRFDPLRIIKAIVVGLGFIGGGTVLKLHEKDKVTHLTSAATILMSAGVGIAVGAQKYIIAVGLTLIVYIINHKIHKLEEKF